MSIIHLFVCIFFVISTISATVQLRAPPVVYSAIIHNEQDAPIDCYVVWLKQSGADLQSDLFTIEQGNQYLVDEVPEDMGSYQIRSIIEEIHCGTLELIAPFDGVESPKLKWNFYVQPDKIVSGQSH